jgi:hypothetical protein
MVSVCIHTAFRGNGARVRVLHPDCAPENDPPKDANISQKSVVWSLYAVHVVEAKWNCKFEMFFEPARMHSAMTHYTVTQCNTV